MPFLLLCGFGLSAFFSAFGAVVFGILAITSPFMRTYTVDGHAATRAEFYHASWPLFLVFLPMLALIAAIAYALWRELPWSRALMLVCWGVSLIAGIVEALSPLPHGDDVWGPLLAYVLGAVVAWWYLYRKGAVVAYYRLLEEQLRDSSMSIGQ